MATEYTIVAQSLDMRTSEVLMSSSFVNALHHAAAAMKQRRNHGLWLEDPHGTLIHWWKRDAAGSWFRAI